MDILGVIFFKLWIFIIFKDFCRFFLNSHGFIWIYFYLKFEKMFIFSCIDMADDMDEVHVSVHTWHVVQVCVYVCDNMLNRHDNTWLFMHIKA